MERFAPVDHASISEPVQFVVRLSSARTVKCDCEDLANHPQPVQRVMGCFSHSLMHSMRVSAAGLVQPIKKARLIQFLAQAHVRDILGF
jgi:hypothetical protein